MGLLDRLRRPKGPRFDGVAVQEWTGDVVETRLDGDLEHAKAEELLAERGRRNVWARIETRANRNGDPKIVAHVGGYIIGEVPAARFKREASLQAVMASGVTVGVVRLSQDEPTVLFLGAGYKYRPRPPWAS